VLLGFICPGAYFKDTQLIPGLKGHYNLRPDLTLSRKTVTPNSRGTVNVKPYRDGKALVAVELSGKGRGDDAINSYIVTEADRKKGGLILKEHREPVTAYYGDITPGWLPSWMGGKPILAEAFIDLGSRAI
jgi:hypothetical protein